MLRQKPKVTPPVGKDAVNFRKILFLPPKETFLLLSIEEWEQIDMRWLSLLKTKQLRAACIARNLNSKGRKKELV
jgi:hypothetical protein